MSPTSQAVQQPGRIAATYSREYPGGWDSDGWVEFHLDVERAQQLEKLLDQVVEVEEATREGALQKATFRVEEAPLTWHHYPGVAFDAERADVNFKEARRACVDDGSALEVDSTLHLARSNRKVEVCQLNVYYDGLEWQAQGERGIQVKTGTLRHYDLARIQLYGGTTRRVREAFRTLSRVAPHQAIEVLKNGIYPSFRPEEATTRRLIAPLLRKEDLSILLQSPHAPDREEALVALPHIDDQQPGPASPDLGRDR